MANDNKERQNLKKGRFSNGYMIVKLIVIIIYFALLINEEKIYFNKLDELFGFELNKENINELEWDPEYVHFYCIPAYLLIIVCAAVAIWFGVTWCKESKRRCGSGSRPKDDYMHDTRKCAKHWM